MSIRHASADIAAAVETFRQGGVVAYPTEAVWGLGCVPTDKQAVHKILNLKQRSVDKGLILVGSSANQFSLYLDGLEKHYSGRFATQPKTPTTWLVPDNGTAPSWIVGKHQSVALRVSDHPIVVALCDALGGPIVSTSANPQGLPAAVNEIQVREYFSATIDCFVTGEVAGASAPSEIKDLLTGEVFRPG